MNLGGMMSKNSGFLSRRGLSEPKPGEAFVPLEEIQRKITPFPAKKAKRGHWGI